MSTEGQITLSTWAVKKRFLFPVYLTQLSFRGPSQPPGFLVSLTFCVCLFPTPRPLGLQPHRRCGWEGVLLHPSVITQVQMAGCLYACWVGSRGGLGTAGSKALTPFPPCLPLPPPISPLGTTKWPSAEGPRGCRWGNMGLYCEAFAQMDPWTVCCLFLTDGICAGGGVGVGKQQRQERQWFLFSSLPCLSLKGPARGHTVQPLWGRTITVPT